MSGLFINTYIKFFFLLTPFFVLSTFLSMTRDFERGKRRKTVLEVTVAVSVISIILLMIGNQIFTLFGITIHSFRIGTGLLLFLSAVNLVQGYETEKSKDPDVSISVVPLAIPVTVGPATTGALLVMGVEFTKTTEKMIALAAILLAVFSVGILLLLSELIERVLKKQGLLIMSKITGLILAAIAAQMVMMGVLGFIK